MEASQWFSSRESIPFHKLCFRAAYQSIYDGVHMEDESPPVIALLRALSLQERQAVVLRMMEASGLYGRGPMGEPLCRYSYDYPAVVELERLVIPVVLSGTLPLDSEAFRAAMREARYTANDVVEALLYYAEEAGLTH